MSVQRKKMGFIKAIRDQHIHRYFTLRRQELQQSASNQQQLLSKAQSLFNKLPLSIHSLVQQLDENYIIVSQFLIKQVKQFCNRMIGIQNVEWCYFVYAINRLLVSTNDKTQIQIIINDSFLPVLEGAESQLYKTSNKIMQSQILKSLLQYCYRLGGYVQFMNQLQQTAMVNTMKRLWDSEWQYEAELCLAQTCLNLFNTNFDAEDEQNITNQQRANAEITKIKLIKQIFYGPDCEQRLAKILHRMMNLIYEQKSQLLNLSLRLLITFTKYTEALIYFYPLLKFNILHVISTIIYTHQKYKNQTIIYNLRLLNNLLMNDVNLTSLILQEFMLSNIIKLYHHDPSSQQIQGEIAQLLINLTHFLNDQEEIIRELISISATEIVIEALGLFSERNDDILLQEGVSSLIIMLNHNPIQVKKVVKQNQKLLIRILEEQVGISDMLQNILQSCQTQPKTL